MNFKDIFKRNKYTTKVDGANNEKVYSEVADQFVPDTYLAKRKTIWAMLKVYVTMYHVVSFGFALFSAWYVSSTYSTGFMVWITFGLLCVVSFGVEALKSTNSDMFFKSRIMGDPSSQFVLPLLICFSLSVLSSSYGGMKLSETQKDNTLGITTNHNDKRDSIQNIYKSDLDLLSANIASDTKDKMKAKSGWQKNVISTRLEKYQDEKSRLSQQMQTDLSKLDSTIETAKVDNVTTKEASGRVSFILVCILEALSLFSYYTIWDIRKNVNIEGHSFSFLGSEQMSNLQVPNIENNLQPQLNTQPQMNSKPNKSNGIGFGAMATHTQGQTAICEHRNCSNTFYKNKSTHRFCSSKCQTSEWHFIRRNK